MDDFLKSVHTTIDGPKVSYHYTYYQLPTVGIKWFVVDNDMLECKGPYDTWKEAEAARDLLNDQWKNALLREAGSNSPSKQHKLLNPMDRECSPCAPDCPACKSL